MRFMVKNAHRYERHNIHLTSSNAEKRADISERNEALRELETYLRQQGNLSEAEIKAYMAYYKANCLEA